MKTFALIPLGLLLRAAFSSRTAFGANQLVQVNLTADGEATALETENAMDGNADTIWPTPFGSGDSPPPHAIDIDLGAEFEIDGFAYLPRKGGGNGTIREFAFFVGKVAAELDHPVAAGAFASSNAWNEVKLPAARKGRYVRLRALCEIAGHPWTSIAELKILCAGVEFRAGTIWSLAIPGRANGPQNELEWQYASLANDLRGRKRIAALGSQTYRAEALILAADRDPADIVSRRTAALLKDLRRGSAGPQLDGFEEALHELQSEVAKAPLDNLAMRYELYERICGLRRQIAFANPLLDFGELLFIKRHRSLFNHMCDQYYGIAARPGGGLCVLSNPL